jgi:bifunctional non-homologous end joining protein LigD
MPLRSSVEPFDDPGWIFELKYDGFRALACVEEGRCRLVSRNGNEFRSFASLSQELGSGFGSTAVVDGEIVCLDSDGKPQFCDLLYRRAEPAFIAFDILWRGQEDLRFLPLVDRKQELRRTLARSRSRRLLYADHVQGNGAELFERVCDLDLEGIVAKHRNGHYTSDVEASTWFKIRNRTYSQWAGRNEAFERDRHFEPVAGWHLCELAAAAVAG